MKDELEIDDKGVRALFRQLYLKRPDVEKIFIETSGGDKDGSGNEDQAQMMLTTENGDEGYFDSYEEAE